MNIAITGGSGFIGTRLKALLEEEGHECRIIDLRHHDPVDILDLPALTAALKGCETVYHLAAEHRDDVFPRSRYYDVNVRGTENVTKAMDANGITKIIFTSSFAVYGLAGGAPDESAPLAPFNDYGQSKMEGEKVLQDWTAQNPSARLTIVRPVVVFGENNRGNVHTLIDQVARNRFIMVGSGKNRKSIAYVGNAASFLTACLTDRVPPGIYNYADGPDLTMNEMMGVICDRLGMSQSFFRLPYMVGIVAGHAFDGIARLTERTFPVSAVRVRKFCADTTSDAGKARATGFKPPYTIEEGLSRMIAHDFKGQSAA